MYMASITVKFVAKALHYQLQLFITPKDNIISKFF